MSELSTRTFAAAMHGFGAGEAAIEVPRTLRIVTRNFLENTTGEAAQLGELFTVPLRGFSAGSEGGQSHPILPLSVIPNVAANPATFDLVVESESSLVPGRVELLSAYLDAQGVSLGTSQMDHGASYFSMGLTDPGAAAYFAAVPFPAAAGDYYIGLAACRVPTVSEQNPKTGVYEYTKEAVVIGLKLEPVSVNLVGSDLEFVLGDSKFLGDSTQVDLTGRTCIVYKTSGPSAASGTAIQQGTISYSASANRVTIIGGLGDGATASTTIGDYRVVIQGPVVTDHDITNGGAGYPGVAPLGLFEQHATNPFYKGIGSSYQPGQRVLPALAQMLGWKHGGAGTGFLEAKEVEYTGGASGSGTFDNVWRIDAKPHSDETLTDYFLAMRNAGGTFTGGIRLDGALVTDAGIITGTGAVTTLGGNLVVNADTDFNGDVDMGRYELFFDPASAPLSGFNVDGLAMVRSGNADQIVIHGSGTTPSMTFDVVAQSGGTGDSKVFAGEFIAKADTSRSLTDGFGRFYADGAGGEFAYNPSLKVVEFPFGGEAIARDGWNWPARWSGTGTPAVLADMFTPGGGLPEIVHVAPSAGGDSFVFEVPVRVPDGVTLEGLRCTWTRRWDGTNVTAVIGGTDGAMTVRLLRQQRGVGTVGRTTLGALSCVANAGILTEESGALSLLAPVDDASERDAAFFLQIDLQDSSAAGQSSVLHWVKLYGHVRYNGPGLY